MKNLIALGSILLTATIATSQNVETYYQFNKKTESGLNVHYGYVRTTHQGTKVDVTLTSQKCESHQYLKGKVVINYEAEDNGYIRNYTLTTIDSFLDKDLEGSRFVASVFVPYVMSSVGTLSVQDNLRCYPKQDPEREVKKTQPIFDPTLGIL